MEQKIRTANAMVHPYDEDGNTWTVEASDAMGREYYRLDLSLSFYRATELAQRIVAAGKINVELWRCHTPYGTEAWLIDGEEERLIEDERFGYF